ncbi:HesA/MoeB/ThiF family protein [Halanaerobacter jeridensis]|uniref:Molybdopterin/thiamine biosynthesis adenylyltransferase n=1 Tax=Halanaerobacter jeridensis TaxID=706427 RepID=A0A939BSZ4_9FIRM|nr:HesA/MoeB/ThiF family protein [Halanaerobacter jeridensis]MBM7557676.1 molybdopterin/thiamine biosynthesis adenylyltransferase [Halanaerobacter jeridensis]
MDFLERQKPMFTKQELDIISNSTVLIAGVGGLGTHQALELQRVGVNKIYLIDSDKIEMSNLNRQVLYGQEDIGKFKAPTAKESLDKFALGTEVTAIIEEISAETEIPEDVDLVLDALDNFASRYQLESLAAEYNLPLIHGGIDSWYGQVTTIVPDETPSLQEIVGGKKEDNEVIPAFSPVVSVIASLQVIEGLKIILGRENNLKNKLLLIDLNDYSINEIEL